MAEPGVNVETLDGVGNQFERRPVITMLVLSLALVFALSYVLYMQNTKHEKQVEALYNRLATSEAEKRKIATDLLLEQIKQQTQFEDLKRTILERRPSITTKKRNK